MNEFQLMGYALAAYAVSGLFVYLWVKYKRIESKRNENEFVNSTIVAIENDAINSIDDIKDLYFGFFGTPGSGLAEIHQLGLLLAKVKLNISSSKISDPSRRKEFLILVNKILDEEKVLSKEEQDKAPFSGVPSPERSLLEDLREITGAREKQFIQDKLGELATAITIRKETVDKLSEEKGQSLRWAKWGLFGTVFFSLLSIVITYYYSSAS